MIKHQKENANQTFPIEPLQKRASSQHPPAPCGPLGVTLFSMPWCLEFQSFLFKKMFWNFFLNITKIREIVSIKLNIPVQLALQIINGTLTSPSTPTFAYWSCSVLQVVGFWRKWQRLMLNLIGALPSLSQSCCALEC